MKFSAPERWLAGLAFMLPLVVAPFLHEHFILPRILIFSLAAIPLFFHIFKQEPAPELGSVGLGLMLCLMATGLSLLLSPSPRLIIPGAALLVAGLAVVSVWNQQRDLERFRKMTALAMILVSGYGFLQLAGLDPVPWNAADLAGRAAVFSTLGNVNWLAAWLAVALHLLITPELIRRRGSRWQQLAVGAGVLLLLLLRSRGALLGFVAGGVIRGVFRIRVQRGFTKQWKRNAGRMLLALLLLAICSETGFWWSGQETFSNRIFSSRGISDRVFIASTALRLLPDCLPFGCGPGNFAYLYPDALAPRLDARVPEMVRVSAHAQHVHVDFIEVLLELGPLGLLGFVLIFCLPLIRGWRNLDPLTESGIAALVAFLVCGLFDSPFSHPATFFLALVAAVTAVSEPSGFNPRRWPRMPGLLRWSLLIFVLILTFRGVGGQVISSLYLAEARHRLAPYTSQDGVLHPAAASDSEILRSLRSALSWSHAHGEAAFRLGALQLLAGKPRDALRLLLLATETMIEPAVEFNLGQACQQLDELRAALQHFRRAADLSPWSRVHARAREGEGRILIAMRAQGAGLDAIFSAMLRDPQIVTEAPAVIHDLGQRGRPALATALAARILGGTQPAVSLMRPDLLALRSRFFLRLGNYLEAFREWQEMELENLKQDRINLAVKPQLDQLLRQSLQEADLVTCWSLLQDRVRYDFIRYLLLP